MQRFIEKALEKVHLLDREAIKQLVLDIAKENSNLEAVLESIHSGIIVCDIDNKPIFANKTAERFLSFESTDVYTQSIWEYIKNKKISDFIKKTITSEETIIERDFPIEVKNKYRIISVSVMPLVQNGQIRGTVIYSEDVTDKRKNESRLKRAENLASLTTLAAGVAHEIKNPLGAMSIHMQLLKKALGNNINSKIKGYLEVIDEEIDRLNKIVVDFLFAVRPMNTEPIRDNLNDLLEEIIEFIKPEIEQNGIELQVKLNKNIPNIFMDRRFIKQAVINLVKNSISATPQGGYILLATDITDEGVQLIVADSGHGIPQDYINKIFEPYFTTKENGTGLGLTLTYKIIKEHNGDISVISEPNIGTKFIISLPVPQHELYLIHGKCSNGETL